MGGIPAVCVRTKFQKSYLKQHFLFAGTYSAKIPHDIWIACMVHKTTLIGQQSKNFFSSLHLQDCLQIKDLLMFSPCVPLHQHLNIANYVCKVHALLYKAQSYGIPFRRRQSNYKLKPHSLIKLSFILWGMNKRSVKWLSLEMWLGMLEFWEVPSECY